MGGAYSMIPECDLIQGFNGTTAAKVNGGDFLSGSDFSLSEAVTPVYNDKVGILTDQYIKMRVSGNNLTEIGQIKQINTVSYLNRPI